MNIDVLMLISGLSHVELKSREEGLKAYASSGTNIRLVTTSWAPPSVDSLPEMELAATGILDRVVKSEEEGADAVIIWGGHDPSLSAARHLVSIPVIGPGMASMHLACMLSETFALIVQLPHVIGLAERQIRDLGLWEKCTGVYPVNLPVLELRKPSSLTMIYDTVMEAISDGSDCICFGCMALNDHSETLQRKLEKESPGVRVIHPGKAVIKLTELILDMNLSHSKLSYPDPPKEVKFPSNLF
jgi:allantoin racemase